MGVKQAAERLRGTGSAYFDLTISRSSGTIPASQGMFGFDGELRSSVASRAAQSR